MAAKRYLIITADDYGIGPETSRGILELGTHGFITASVLLVNSPYAEQAVRAWRLANRPFELGWHPCLTLDAPVLPAEKVPSLVGPEGRFFGLGNFVKRLWLGQIQETELRAELQAQWERFVHLVGHPPTVVNSHHHVQVFTGVGRALRTLLNRTWPIPYMRRVREPWLMLGRVPGARGKRAFLSWLGRADAQAQDRLGFPGNDWLAGITDPPCVADPDFLTRWLTRIPSEVVELTCHPGYLDETLLGRDCTADDGQLQRRVRELELLQQPCLRDACQEADFTLVSPSGLLEQKIYGDAHAA